MRGRSFTTNNLSEIPLGTAKLGTTMTESLVMFNGRSQALVSYSQPPISNYSIGDSIGGGVERGGGYLGSGYERLWVDMHHTATFFPDLVYSKMATMSPTALVSNMTSLPKPNTSVKEYFQQI